MRDKIIIVLYIGVGHVRSADIDDYVNSVTVRIVPNIENAEIIVIPIDGVDTRIECINPQYVTDNELIEKHTSLMHEINNKLQEQINLIKNE